MTMSTFMKTSKFYTELNLHKIIEIYYDLLKIIKGGISNT